ncbi:MAG: thiol:disulfide interchange protein DsbA/DsbL [Gammaproteobacteria bacterium]|nr:thiol:disulfide interchange protein DsbA/DsbL [Gammaproteobacteria bacterium]
MKKMITAALLLSASLLPLSSMAMPEAFIDGVHYKATPTRLATNSEGKIEVIELFSYSCPHCFRLDPQVELWKQTLPENVTFKHVPAIFRDSWLQLARVFYAAEATGDLEKLHPLLFNAIHVEKRQLLTEEQLLDFVAEQDIDRESFAKTMKSMSVSGKVKKALMLSQTSGITGVPAMIVNGQYRTDAPLAGGMSEMLNTVDFLIQKESVK